MMFPKTKTRNANPATRNPQTKAKIRETDQPGRHSIPVIDTQTNQEKYLNFQGYVPSQQPDELDDDFYNTLITVGNKKYLAPSIDLEFK